LCAKHNACMRRMIVTASYYECRACGARCAVIMVGGAVRECARVASVIRATTRGALSGSPPVNGLPYYYRKPTFDLLVLLSVLALSCGFRMESLWQPWKKYLRPFYGTAGDKEFVIGPDIRAARFPLPSSGWKEM